MVGIKRDITDKIINNLDTSEILLLVGARQSGKTTILRQVQEFLSLKGISVFFLNLEDPAYLDLLNQHPRNLFKIFPFDLGKRNYIIVDEVQYLSNPTNFLKFIYDEYQAKIKLLVSGSSAFYIDRKFKDSLAGRKNFLKLELFHFPSSCALKIAKILNPSSRP